MIMPKPEEYMIDLQCDKCGLADVVGYPPHPCGPDALELESWTCTGCGHTEKVKQNA